jgi:hypothetical protein
MRLLDTYAVDCGATIDKPLILEAYFPLPFEKYIIFQSDTPYDSRNYAYWQDVIDFIHPVLEKLNIKIIQTGLQKERAYKKVVDLRGQTSLPQLAYIMKRSLLSLSPDSFNTHLASIYDIPIVSLYSISMPEVAGPHFGSKEKQILFKAYENVGNKKPSYSSQESPKSINTVHTEDIANAVFKLLNIDFTVPFKTLFIGNKYCNGMVRQLIPNTIGMISDPQAPVEIRMDIVFDEKILTHHLSYLTKALIITDKPISIDLLKHFKKNIQVVAYKITNNDDPKFVENLIGASIPLVLISELSQEELVTKKLNYYEYGNISEMDIPNEKMVEELKKESNLYYRSSLLIANKKNIFSSHAAIEKGVPLTTDGQYQEVIDSPKFWKDMEFYIIFKSLTKE